MNYKLENFPAMPDALQEACRNSIKTTESLVKLSYGDEEFAGSKWDIRPQHFPDHLGFEKTQDMYQYIKNRDDQFVTFSIHETPQAVIDWFTTTINPLIQAQYRVDRISLFVISEGNIGYPHVDPTPAVFNFMIDTSGDKVVTQFWKIKEQFKEQKIYPINIYPYEKLELVDEINVPVNTWVFLKVSNLHSITGLDPHKPRIILQVEVTEQPLAVPD
jgi:hypothetical protein